MTYKLVYAVMIQKQNGSVLAPIIFESSEDAKAEAKLWKDDPRCLDVWIMATHFHKKQRVPA